MVIKYNESQIRHLKAALPPHSDSPPFDRGIIRDHFPPHPQPERRDVGVGAVPPRPFSIVKVYAKRGDLGPALLQGEDRP